MASKRSTRSQPNLEESVKEETKVAIDNIQMNPQRVFLIPDSICKSEEFVTGKLKIDRFPHPRTGTPILLMIKDRKLFEIVSHSTQEGFCSFIIDQTIEKDGKFYTITPFDARFLVLEKLREIAKDVNISDHFDGPLVEVIEELDLESFADVREVCNQKLSRFNETKTLEWLSAKVQKVAQTLAKSDISCGANARSKLLIKSEKTSVSPEDCLHSAFDLVCEYVSPSIAERLGQVLSIEKKRPLIQSNVAPEMSETKRRKTEEPLENYSADMKPKIEVKKVPKLTNAQRKLANSDKTGMKSIASFFEASKKTTKP